MNDKGKKGIHRGVRQSGVWKWRKE